MIDEEVTFMEKGYRSTELSKWSKQEVWAVCEGEDCQREGGRGRWVRKDNYRDLCTSCARRGSRMVMCETYTEKRECIDDDITYAEKGYRSTDLKSSSHKEVWAVCEGENCEREGGRGRWVKFYACSDLCFLCAMKNLPIQNCKVPTKKLDYIDDDITFAEKGYRSTDLKQGSHMPVWCVCANPDCEREGGRGRWLMFQDCRELCHLCMCRTDEFRVKSSDTNKGENHPNWQGGKSFEPYCPKFDEAFKEAVREKFDRKCFLCGEDEDDDMKLDVHHVNYDKECICNGVECEFVPLHRGCHMRTNYYRDLWERLIINVLDYEGWI